MALSLDQIVARVEGLKQRHSAKDIRNSAVLCVRRGEADQLMPAAFSDEWPKPIVANMIDTGARDLSEVTGVAPSINCSTTKQSNDTARKRADARTRIANWYASSSHLESQLPLAADYYYTLGMAAFRVEPCTDGDTQRPHISVENTTNAYPEFNRWGDCVAYARRFYISAAKLQAQYPERGVKAWLSIGRAQGLGGFDDGWREKQVEVCRYDDADQSVLYAYHPTGAMASKYLKLASWDNPIGRCLVFPVVRPSVDTEIRGQFDDAIYIYLAEARYAALSLRAAKQAVDAPLAVPMDMQNITLGANSVLRTREPQNIRRVGADIPAGAFAAQQLLQDQLRQGIRYPESRTGNIDAAVVTGRGVQALEGGFDSQVKIAQLYFADQLTRAIEAAFEIDETVWPDVERSIRGMESGSPFEMTYTPAKDIKGDFTVDVTYGMFAGMDPNRSLVFLLQALQAGLISQDTAMRNLPTSMNVTEEEKQIDIESTRDALQQGILALAQSVPQLAMQGGDPSEAIAKIAAVIDGRKKGQSIEDAAMKAFAPAPPPEGSVAPGSETPSPSGAPGEAAPGGGLTPDGLPPGVAQGQAGMAPGGRPDLAYMMAGLGSNGQANLSSSVVKRVPAA